MPLRNFAKAFQLTESKGHFPHFFSTLDRFGYEGPRPEPDMYGADYMKTNVRSDFMVWYESVQNEAFNFDEEIDRYCMADVTILRQGCCKFRHQFMAVTRNQLAGIEGICPFQSVTIAAACQVVFRTLFLTENTIGIVPNHGYRPAAVAHSMVAIQYLNFVSMVTDTYIQHAENLGEHQILKYHVDGYCKETNTVYEFCGCAFHACPRCYTAKIKAPYSDNINMGQLYNETMARLANIKATGVKMDVIWGCDWEIIKKMPFIREVLDTQLAYVSPLMARDSLYGKYDFF
jgi:hypothetical protein